MANDMRPAKGKNKWVVMVKFASLHHHCETCEKDMVEFAQYREIEIDFDVEGRFYAPYEWLEVKCPHEGPYKGEMLLKSAYV
jgi:hypothetical protein